MPRSHWIVCQLGAREHYAVPRALHAGGRLALFVTDLWFKPGRRGVISRLLARGLPRIAARQEPSLHDVPTVAFTGTFLGMQLLRRLMPKRQRLQDALTFAMDDLFQRCAARVVRRWRHIASDGSDTCTVFCYSYSARRVFRAARKRGWLTVLGQINPGPREEEIVREVYRREFGASTVPPAATAVYWRRWREECALADAIVVNSVWSRQLLVEEGVPEKKIYVVPLAYEPPPGSAEFRRTYPTAFTPERPLRLLYLGAAHPRKGLHVLLRVMEKFAAESAPVELLIVGRDEMPGGLAGRLPSNSRHHAEVERSRTAEFFQTADVFILPTFSDGFALTLLEAQAWRLPVIASTRCGRVVEDAINGMELATVDENAVASAITACLRSPDRLARFAENPADLQRYSLAAIGQQLAAVVSSLDRSVTAPLAS